MECNGNLADAAVSGSAEDLSDYTDADESISAPTEILAEVFEPLVLCSLEVVVSLLLFSNYVSAIFNKDVSRVFLNLTVKVPT